LIPINKRRHKSCCLWRWIRSKLCFNFSWICCFSECCSCPRSCSCCQCECPSSQCCEASPGRP
ncbi:unnamed protein product, partial [Musa acuminata subsp. burmannicoides]